MKSKVKADLFFFGIVFLVQFFMVMGVIKQMQAPVFKQGLQDTAKVLTKTVE